MVKVFGGFVTAASNHPQREIGKAQRKPRQSKYSKADACTQLLPRVFA